MLLYCLNSCYWLFSYDAINYIIFLQNTEDKLLLLESYFKIQNLKYVSHYPYKPNFTWNRKVFDLCRIFQNAIHFTKLTTCEITISNNFVEKPKSIKLCFIVHWIWYTQVGSCLEWFRKFFRISMWITLPYKVERMKLDICK